MTRFRIRLLITLALLTAGVMLGAATADAGWIRPDGPSLSSDTSVDGPRPAVRPTSGEPDLPSGSPSRVNVRGIDPPGGIKPVGYTHPRGSWVQRVWAVWITYLKR